MEVYEIHLLPDSPRCVLSGPLGAVDRLEFDSVREAALHAQSCAMGVPAILRLLHVDGTLKNERPIPPPKNPDPMMGSRPVTWF